MNNQIAYTIPHSASWAETGVTAPFVFIPCSITAQAAAVTSLPLVTNITGCPSTLTVVDGASSAADTDGVFTGGTGTYGWFGADHDESGGAMFDAFDFTRGATNGIGGKLVMIRFRLSPGNVSTTNHTMIMFGGGGIGGWRLRVPATNRLDLDVTTGSFGAATTLDIGSAGMALNTEKDVLLLMDCVNGEVYSFLNGAAVSLTTTDMVAALDAAVSSQLASASTGNGLTFFAGQNDTTIDTRTISAPLIGTMRDVLLMDLTDYASDVVTNRATLADKLYRCPPYSLPRYLERFA